MNKWDINSFSSIFKISKNVILKHQHKNARMPNVSTATTKILDNESYGNLQVTSYFTSWSVGHAFALSSLAPVKLIDSPGSSENSNRIVFKPNIAQSIVGVGNGRQAGGIILALKCGHQIQNPGWNDCTVCFFW